METLVIDIGTTMTGVYSVEESLYMPYRGDDDVCDSTHCSCIRANK
jgi:hypothetical protein